MLVSLDFRNLMLAGVANASKSFNLFHELIIFLSQKPISSQVIFRRC
jgi:hypothetical protein